MIANFVGQSRDRRGHKASSRHRRSLSWESGGGMTILEPRALLTDLVSGAVATAVVGSTTSGAAAMPATPPPSTAVSTTTQTTITWVYAGGISGVFAGYPTTQTSTVYSNGTVQVVSTTTDPYGNPLFSINMVWPQGGQMFSAQMEVETDEPDTFTITISGPASAATWPSYAPVPSPYPPGYPDGYTFRQSTTILLYDGRDPGQIVAVPPLNSEVWQITGPPGSTYLYTFMGSNPAILSSAPQPNPSIQP